MTADGGRFEAGRSEASGHTLGEGQERALELLWVPRVNGEGVLMADGLGLHPVADRRGIDTAGALRKVGAMPTEAPHQQGRLERSQVADGPDSVVLECMARLGPDTPQAPDGQRRQEGGFVARRDDDQAVGLAQLGGDLGHQLGRRDPDGSRQSDLVGDGAFDGNGDLGWVAEEGLGAGHVEEGFVDRDRLDEGGEAPHDGHHLTADGGVLAAVNGQEDSLRAERAGRSQRHRRADAERSRLVRGRADHAPIGRAATTDDDGATP